MGFERKSGEGLGAQIDPKRLIEGQLPRRGPERGQAQSITDPVAYRPRLPPVDLGREALVLLRRGPGAYRCDEKEKGCPCDGSPQMMFNTHSTRPR